MSTPNLPPTIPLSELAWRLNVPLEKLPDIALSLAALGRDPVACMRDERKRLDGEAAELARITSAADARNAAARARERAEGEARAAARIAREQKQAAAYSAASPEDAAGIHRV
jgi:hypothetical protein